MAAITKADRELIAALAARLAIQDWQIRVDDRGPCFLAAGRGTVRPVDSRLVVSLRPAAACEVEGLRQRLIGAGVLAVTGTGTMVMTRMPADEVEVATMRGLLGLHRGGGSPAPSVTA
jgi:hypothetical protein